MAGKIKIVKNGPYIVSGSLPLNKEIILADEEGFAEKWQKGEKYPEKEGYGLCRCGESRNKPFCDGSHISCRFDGTETASKKKYIEFAEKTEGEKLILTDCYDLCASAKFCDRKGGTWQLTKESGDPEKKKLAIEQACNCPSGRLVAWENGKAIEPNFKQSISLVEDNLEKVSGPIWVRGRIPVESSDGKEYEKRNRATLCRCGKSENKPFCDGAHISCKFNDGHFKDEKKNL
jgi:CDGSH-type Zn-finger protein